MKNLNLLIVEDDQEVINTYLRNIKSFNFESVVKIQPTVVTNKDKAIELLKDKSGLFDSAIVDLMLSSPTKKDDQFSGNDVLKVIKNDMRFPIFVVTGTPQHIAAELKEESTFFRILTRGEEGDILNKIVSIYNTGITNILGKRGEIETYLNNIFWNHLSNSMEPWISDTSRTPNQKEKSILRYTLLHMQEYIDEEIEKYHPSEFYISAPIKKEISTGDIVKYGGDRFIVLTPACDIVKRADGNRNTTMILLCKIKKISDVFPNYGNLTQATSEKNQDRLRLNALIENKKQNFHFIPKCGSIDAGLIDFQEKTTVNAVNIDQSIKDKIIIRIATVSYPFLKDIIARYANYYARQGSPDFDVTEVYNSITPASLPPSL